MTKRIFHDGNFIITSADEDGLVTFKDNVVIEGDLTITGIATETVIESEITVFRDPIIELGLPSNDAPLGSLWPDVGIKFNYYNGTDFRGFFGWDDDPLVNPAATTPPATFPRYVLYDDISNVSGDDSHDVLGVSFGTFEVGDFYSGSVSITTSGISFGGDPFKVVVTDGSGNLDTDTPFSYQPGVGMTLDSTNLNLNTFSVTGSNNLTLTTDTDNIILISETNITNTATTGIITNTAAAGISSTATTGNISNTSTAGEVNSSAGTSIANTAVGFISNTTSGAGDISNIANGTGNLINTTTAIMTNTVGNELIDNVTNNIASTSSAGNIILTANSGQVRNLGGGIINTASTGNIANAAAIDITNVTVSGDIRNTAVGLGPAAGNISNVADTSFNNVAPTMSNVATTSITNTTPLLTFTNGTVSTTFTASSNSLLISPLHADGVLLVPAGYETRAEFISNTDVLVTKQYVTDAIATVISTSPVNVVGDTFALNDTATLNYNFDSTPDNYSAIEVTIGSFTVTSGDVQTDDSELQKIVCSWDNNLSVWVSTPAYISQTRSFGQDLIQINDVSRTILQLQNISGSTGTSTRINGYVKVERIV